MARWSHRPTKSVNYRRWRLNPGGWARELGVAKEAVELYLDADVIDLHVDSFLWQRALPGYRLARRHRPVFPGSAFLGQADLPRVREAALTGVCWDTVANPLLPGPLRARSTVAAIGGIAATLRRHRNDFRIARTLAEYRAAKRDGVCASFLTVQGGHGFDHSLDALDRIPDDLVVRITLVHLTRSRIGFPNARPSHAKDGLTDFGRAFVERLQEKRILVDLAHINRGGFFDALEVSDPSIPVIVSHTGVQACRSLWRNIDDDQIRAIADRGGTIGIIFHPYYLTGGIRCSLERILDHAAHVIDLVGDDFVSLGSDLDGGIWLPLDLEDITRLPRLVAAMLVRRWSEDRIRKLLGGNFLRVLGAVRPE